MGGCGRVTWKNSLRHTCICGDPWAFNDDIEKTKDSIGHGMTNSTLRNHYLGFYPNKDAFDYFYAADEEEAFMLCMTDRAHGSHQKPHRAL